MTQQESKSTGFDEENGHTPFIHLTGDSEAPSEQATTTACARLAYITDLRLLLLYVSMLTTLIAGFYEMDNSDSKSSQLSGYSHFAWHVALLSKFESERWTQNQLLSIFYAKVSDFIEFFAILSMIMSSLLTDSEDLVNKTSTCIAGSLFAVSTRLKPELIIASSMTGTAASISLIFANAYPKVSIPGIAVGVSFFLWQLASVAHAWKLNSQGESHQNLLATR